MPSEYSIPMFAQTVWVVIVFIVSLIVFDVVLVRWLKLQNRAWKHVDYVWLAVGALGLIGAVEGPRRSIAVTLANLAESRLTGSISTLNATAQFGVSPATCRTFVRSDASPPEPEFSRTQREYDQVCAWFKQVQPRMPSRVTAVTGAVTISALALSPDVTNAGLIWQLERFRSDLLAVNQQIATLATLREAQKRGFFEDLMHYLGPMLLAVAIALRITKVTGEIKNEK